jgi:hypothetical protein
MQRTRTVETARFKAKAADGRSFDIVEMATQEILPSTDGRLDTWRLVRGLIAPSSGTQVNRARWNDDDHVAATRQCDSRAGPSS